MPLPDPSSKKKLPGPPAQKDHYSVEEMMERLRGESAGEGRRRKKRRSLQLPAKPRGGGRKKWFIAGGVVLGLWLVVLGIHLLNRWRVQSEVFRASANKRFSSMLGCAVEWERFSPRGWHDMDCAGVKLTGGGAFRSAEFHVLAADLTAGSFFLNEWDITNLFIEDGKVVFQTGTAPGQEGASAAADPPPDSGFRLGISPSPSFASAHTFRVGNLVVEWPGSDGKPVRLEDVEAVGTLSDQKLNVRGTHGTMNGGLLGGSPIQGISVNLKRNRIEVENLSLRLGPNAQLSANGAIDFNPAGTTADLEVRIAPVQAQSVQVQELLPTAWKDRVSGKISITGAKYVAKPGAPEELSGDFVLDGALFMELPVLQTLCNRFQSDTYSKLEFKTLGGHFSRTPQRLVIDRISATREGFAKLNGSVTLWADGRLEGKLRLGLNTPETEGPGIVAQEEGLDVMEFNLGGTSLEPTDDLKEKFGQPAASAALPSAPITPSAAPSVAPSAELPLVPLAPLAPPTPPTRQP